MTVEDQIRYLQSKIASLEARLASSQSQADNPTTEGRLLGNPQPTVDPKGRKIWEAEWRGDYKVMMAYVPDNALIIDGENVEVEADDKEGDEVTLSDGPWYLHAYKNKTTGNWEAELDQEPTGTREDEEAKYNIHICDIHEDGYIEKQYVVGSIVIGGAGSKFVGDYDGSEVISGDEEPILVTGHPGEEDAQGHDSHSGLQFLTVSARKGAEAGEKTPPKIIARIIDKDESEDWAAREMTFTDADGNQKTVHFLGSENAEIGGGGGGGGGGEPSDDGKSSKSGRYAIVSISNGVVRMKNAYFNVGGKTYIGNENTATLIGGNTDVVALRIKATGSERPVDSIVVYDSVTALQTDQEDEYYYTIPLYLVSTAYDEETDEETYSVICDFRTGPDSAMGEF